MNDPAFSLFSIFGGRAQYERSFIMQRSLISCHNKKTSRIFLITD